MTASEAVMTGGEIVFLSAEFEGIEKAIRLWEHRCGWLERNGCDQEYERREAATLDLTREIGVRGDSFAAWLGINPGAVLRLIEARRQSISRMEAPA